MFLLKGLSFNTFLRLVYCPIAWANSLATCSMATCFKASSRVVCDDGRPKEQRVRRSAAGVYNTPTPGTLGLFCVRVAGDRRLAACRFALPSLSLPSAGVPVAGVPLSKGRAPWFPSAGLVRHCLINIQIYGKFADYETATATPFQLSAIWQSLFYNLKVPAPDDAVTLKSVML